MGKINKSLVIKIVSIILIIIVIATLVALLVNSKQNSNYLKVDEVRTQYIDDYISNTEIKNAEEAKQVINNIIDYLPIDSIEELELSRENQIPELKTYYFHQVYHGIEVYNSGLLIYTNENGVVLGGHHNLRRVSGQLERKTTDSEIEEIIKNKLKDVSNKKIDITPYIYVIEGKAVLAYECIITNSNPNVWDPNYKMMIIRDSDKKIMINETYSNIIE